jgi:LemA protein
MKLVTKLLQRRNDLIGNLVNVKGAAELKKHFDCSYRSTCQSDSVTVDPTNITRKLAQFNQAQSGVSSSSRLLVSVERYPELKANQNFLKLQDELQAQKIKFYSQNAF